MRQCQQPAVSRVETAGLDRNLLNLGVCRGIVTKTKPQNKEWKNNAFKHRPLSIRQPFTHCLKV